MLCQSCSRPITVRSSLLLNGAPRADICADCPPAFPTLPIGTRVQHLGSPQYVGTVAGCRQSVAATDPCHVELTVDWDAGCGPLRRSLCGIQSVRTLPACHFCGEAGATDTYREEDYPDAPCCADEDACHARFVALED